MEGKMVATWGLWMAEQREDQAGQRQQGPLDERLEAGQRRERPEDRRRSQWQVPFLS